MTVGSEILIIELKSKIEEVTNVPKDRQRLVYMAKLLKDEDSLSKYITEDDNTVHMMANLANND